MKIRGFEQKIKKKERKSKKEEDSNFLYLKYFILNE